MTKNYLRLLSVIALMFVGANSAQAQCVPRSSFFYGEMLPNNGCGVFASYLNFGPGEYFRMPVLQGGSYTISTCGNTIDTQITGFQGSITATSIFDNDDNGPDCSPSLQSSIDITPTFTDYVRVNVNEFNCLPGGSASITVKVRQNNNLTFTSSGTDMCVGQTRVLTATPAPVTVTPQPNSGDVGTFSGTGVSGTTFTAPTPAGASQTFTVTYSFGYCSTTQDITVFAQPSTANAGSDQLAICGTSATLAAATPTIGSGMWSVVSGPGSVTTPGATNSSVTGLVSGTPTILQWTVSNGPCLTSTDQVTLQVETVAPIPTVGTLTDATGECSVTPTAPLANDNCAGVITGVPDVTFPVTSFGTTIVTWTYDDGSGNIATQTQNVIVSDNTAPVESSPLLSDVNAECAVTSVPAPTANDNCVGLVSGTPSVTFPITAQGTTTIIWTYDDGNGNTSTQLQDVVIDDITAPVSDSISLVDITDPCMVASIPAPTATDNCAGTITATPDVSFPITGQGLTVVTWTWDDGNGNTETQTQNVTITDAAAPVADSISLPAIADECSVASLTAPTATDNCAGSIVGTPDVTFPISTQGTTTVTWTFDDGNGNTSTQTQDVIITDVTAPVADVTTLSDYNDCNSATPPTPTATDNCGGTITGTPDVSFPITSLGTTTVTWTYDDGNGNTSTQTQDVIVNSVDAGVTQAGAVLTADQAGATYQWLDCDNNMAVIIGETNQSLTPLAITGNYAVEVTINGCVDTSTCYLVDYTGIEDVVNNIEVLVYPNPNDGKFNVELVGLNGSDLELRITDLQGRIVLIEKLEGIAGTHIQKVDISQNESGVYIISVIGENGTLITKRIIKE